MKCYFILMYENILIIAYKVLNIIFYYISKSRSQWPRGLRRRSAAARLLRSWVRFPLEHGCLSAVSVVCCQLEVSATS